MGLDDAGGPVGVGAVGGAGGDAARWGGEDVGGVAVDGEEVAGALDYLALGGGELGEVGHCALDGLGVVAGEPHGVIEPAELVVVASLNGVGVGGGGCVGDEVVGGHLHGPAAGALELVSVPVDDCAVGQECVVDAVEGSLGACDAIFWPVA